MNTDYYIVRVSHRPAELPIVAVCHCCDGAGCDVCRHSGLDCGTTDRLAAQFQTAGRELIASMFAQNGGTIHA